MVVRDLADKIVKWKVMLRFLLAFSAATFAHDLYLMPAKFVVKP